jgi:CubicO group peptidase (beta-lactamase class C family)
VLQPSQLLERLDAVRGQHGVPGISAAIWFDGQMTVAASGIANLSAATVLTTDTVMHIGSIAKVFTATLVLQLVDDGLVRLDQPVVEVLPELRLGDAQAAGRLTVRMLLNHTSGIDADLLPDGGPDGERIEDAIRRFGDAGQLFAPGTDCSYSNPGAVIAGYLAQRVRGRSWYELVRERLYQPLDMKDAVALPAETLRRRASVGHRHDIATGKAATVDTAFLPFSYAPAGATLMMSAADLLTFVRAHLVDAVAGARLMREPSAEFWGPPRDRRVGLGWMLDDHGVVSHGGGGPGIAAHAVGDPASGFAGVVLTNSERGAIAIQQVLDPIARELAGLQLFPSIDSAPPSAQPVVPAPYVGSYASNLLRIEVGAQAGGLAAHMQAAFPVAGYAAPPPMLPLQALGDDRFGVRGMPQLGQVVAFGKPDASGRHQFLSMGSPARLLRRRDATHAPNRDHR